MDTKSAHGKLPNVEGDGISYSGIVWFVVILTVTTLVCQILMWVLLRAMQHQAPDAAMMASPMAPATVERQAPVGRVYPDMVAIGKGMDVIAGAGAKIGQARHPPPDANHH